MRLQTGMPDSSLVRSDGWRQVWEAGSLVHQCTVDSTILDGGRRTGTWELNVPHGQDPVRPLTATRFEPSRDRLPFQFPARLTAHHTNHLSVPIIARKAASRCYFKRKRRWRDDHAKARSRGMESQSRKPLSGCD
jgi:hypothetical protein